MELHGVGVQHIGVLAVILLGAVRILGLLPGRRSASSVLRTAAASIAVVDCHTRLDVVAEDAELHAASTVLNALSLHQHTSGEQILALEYRRHAVEDMIGWITFQIVSDLILERQHTLDI